jgi:hypothetical protein
LDQRVSATVLMSADAQSTETPRQAVSNLEVDAAVALLDGQICPVCRCKTIQNGDYTGREARWEECPNVNNRPPGVPRQGWRG